MAISKHTNPDLSSTQQQTNGIVTVNDEYNPSAEERDSLIANEPDTERLRSERQSVEENEEQKGQK